MENDKFNQESSKPLIANLSSQNRIPPFSMRTKDWVLQHFGQRPVRQKEVARPAEDVDIRFLTQLRESSSDDPNASRSPAMDSCP